MNEKTARFLRRLRYELKRRGVSKRMKDLKRDWRNMDQKARGRFRRILRGDMDATKDLHYTADGGRPIARRA